MEMSRQEQTGLWIGVATATVPGLIASGFFPQFNVLPSVVWLSIAAFGGMVAGLVASPSPVWGSVSGFVAGAGVIPGIWGYVAVRSMLTESNEFLRLEIAIGALLGATPGLILYGYRGSRLVSRTGRRL